MTVEDYLGKFPFTDAAREAVSDEFSTDDAFNESVLARAIERVRNGVDNKNTEPDDEISAEIDLLSYPVARILVSLLDDTRIISRYAKAEAKTAIYQYLDSDSSQEQQDLAQFYTKTTLTLEDLCEEYGIPVEELSQEDIAAELGTDVIENLSETETSVLLEKFDVNPESVDATSPEQAIRTISSRTTVSRSDPMYRVPIESYVQSSAKLEGSANSLSNMLVKNGFVYISHEVLLSVLEQLVYSDIMDGLPVSVPEEIEDSIQVQDAVDIIRHTIDEQYFTYEIDEVDEEQFPPCMKVLLEKTRKGEHLEHNARFAIASFLVNIGMTTDEIVELFGGVPDFVEDTTRYQINHIRGDVGSTEYTSPSCATMVTQGLCVNKDDLCEEINHPLSYYRIRLRDFGDAEELVDDGDEAGDDEGENVDE